MYIYETFFNFIYIVKVAIGAPAGAAEAPTKAANTAAGAAGEGGPPKLSVFDICVIEEDKWSNILF